MTAAPGPDPLVIRSLEFLGGMAAGAGWRPESDLPEIAFAGRSNVGKSSLLNRLVRRKAFARVSRTPGRTREINFFRVNNQFLLADLPGYGYAKISKQQKADWRPLIDGYLKNTPRLAGVVQLLDIRRDPSGDDMAMLDFLAELQIPTIVVLTKSDKISRAAVTERTGSIMHGLSLEEEQIIPFSSSSGEGRDELARALVGLLDVVKGQAP
jgi:GTP-binding protein